MKAANDNRTGKDFIYIVTSPEQDAFKVGYSSGTPRLPSLQTGNPAKLHLLRAVPAEYPCEASIHKALAEFRIRGEWFRDIKLTEWLLWELLDAVHAADQCGRLMTPDEAFDAVKEAIRLHALPPGTGEDDEDEEMAA